MSQLDLIAEIRAAPARRARRAARARPSARRRRAAGRRAGAFTWRRALVVAIAVAASPQSPACCCPGRAATRAAGEPSTRLDRALTPAQRRPPATPGLRRPATDTARRRWRRGSAKAAPVRRRAPPARSATPRRSRCGCQNAAAVSAATKKALRDRRRDRRPPVHVNVDAERAGRRGLPRAEGAAQTCRRPSRGSARSARSSARTSRSRISRPASTRPRGRSRACRRQLADLRDAAADRGRRRADRRALRRASRTCSASARPRLRAA